MSASDESSRDSTMEILKSPRRCPKSVLTSFVKEVRISLVPGSNDSEVGTLYKAVLVYRSSAGDMRTTTRRFFNITEARTWGRKQFKEPNL